MSSLFILLLAVAVWILVGSSPFQYRCFLITLEKEELRRKRFFENHDPKVPIEVIYGPDTRDVETARVFEDEVVPAYFKKAVEMHYNPDILRPNITFFNLGAIGCYFAHLRFYSRAMHLGLKYAVVFEDNVIVKSKELYAHIQDVIDRKKDDFELCLFHCLSRLPFDAHEESDDDIERVRWISSTKCYLVHVPNMKKYMHNFLPMDNHIDLKTEDVIAKGARVFYKDLRDYMYIDRSHNSTIGHRDHGQERFISRQNKNATIDDVKWGY